MAKKNSTKTATQEALSAAEPKLQTFKGWQGINIEQTPLEWQPDHRYWSEGKMQTDLATNFLLIQNNVKTESNGTLETRQEAKLVLEPPTGMKFTGVTHLHENVLFAACYPEGNSEGDQDIYMINLDDAKDPEPNSILNSWYKVSKEYADNKTYTTQWTNIFSYTVNGKNVLIAQANDGPAFKMAGDTSSDSSASLLENEIGIPAAYYTDGNLDGESVGDWQHHGYVTDTNSTIDASNKIIETSDGVFKDTTASDEDANTTSYHQREDEQGNIFTATFDEIRPTKLENERKPIKNAVKIADPTNSNGYKFDIKKIGSQTVSTSTTLSTDTSGVQTVGTFTFVIENKFGSTRFYSPYLQRGLHLGAAQMTYENAIQFQVDGLQAKDDITAINFYVRWDNSSTWLCCGRVENNKTYDDAPLGTDAAMGTSQFYENSDGTYYVKCNYFGSIMGQNSWTNANLEPLNLNTTKGPVTKYGCEVNGRLYFWGYNEMPYRLYIGGNAGNELKYDSGYGGGQQDIAPNTGLYITNVLKFKTSSGADITTILCGHKNSHKVKRYNLLETTITMTSEISSQSFDVEEVSNVVGCSSLHGSLVAADGLYYLTRYGLGVTTMAMEYSSQMRTQYVSDVIKPVFTDRKANELNNACMVCIDDVLYFALATDDKQLDHVIFCYDTGSKAFYTFTVGNEDDQILHIYNHDYEANDEGIGIVMPDKIITVPVTGHFNWKEQNYDMDVQIETGELSSSQPTTNTVFVDQLEFRFDYFVGEVEILLEGVDHYGRHVQVQKTVWSDEISYDHIEWMKVGYLLENYHIRILGHAHFRMTHFIAKVYTYGNKFGIQYGFDTSNGYRNRKGGWRYHHHQVKNYNNLKECILT